MMADLAQLDLRMRGGEARTRALLEDVIEQHMGIKPNNRLALAVWFTKSLDSREQQLLEVFSGLPKEGFAETRFSLLWKTGSDAPPYVNIRATSVDYFGNLLHAHPDELALYREKYEVLYFDKNLLNPAILEFFAILTEPSGLMKGWYVDQTEHEKAKNMQTLLSRHSHTRPEIGLVKTEESADFENCRGLLQVETSQRWMPLSPEGIHSYSFYNDKQNERRVFFLFEGGALFELLRFEFKTAPEYGSRLLGKTRDDRYPEVYLRAVQTPAQSAA